jgi:hypothetical protein
MTQVRPPSGGWVSTDKCMSEFGARDSKHALCYTVALQQCDLTVAMHAQPAQELAHPPVRLIDAAGSSVDDRHL